MAMAHLKIDKEFYFEFEKKDNLLIFTVTKDDSGVEDQFGVTAGIVENITKKGRINQISIIPHDLKEQIFTTNDKKTTIETNNCNVVFDEWFKCTTGNFTGKILPMYRIKDSDFYILIKDVFRPVGRM